MTEERDPLIQSLFAESESDLTGDDFTAIVMQRVERERRIRRFAMIAIGLLLFLGFGLLALPLQGVAVALSGALSLPILPVSDSIPAVIFSPINSVAGALTLGLLALRIGYKAIFP